MLAALRRTRYGYLLAFYILLLCGWAQPHGDCRQAVLLTLQYVPYRPGLSPENPGLGGR